MLILLSPAKTLDMDTPARVRAPTQPDLLDEAGKLVRTLKQYRKLKLADLMNISVPLAELNVERFQSFELPFNPDNARPAVQAFRGDVYRGLDADTMKAADLKWAQAHLRILSGLYGVLKPLDLMQAYRLEMGTRLKTRRGQTLYEFWGSRITDALNAELDTQKTPCVINLASNEYARAVKVRELNAPMSSPVFRDEKNGDYRVISFFAKRARGAMARHLIDHRITDASDLAGFNALGYRYNAKASRDGQPVFMRTEKSAEPYLAQPPAVPRVSKKRTTRSGGKVTSGA